MITCSILELRTRLRVLVDPPLGTWKRILLRTERKILSFFAYAKIKIKTQEGIADSKRREKSVV